MKKLNIKYYLDEGAYAPEKAHPSDAGFDLRIPHDTYIAPRGSITVDTGVHMLIPDGYVGFLKSKSGLNVKKGLRGEGVIDAGYTGSIVVKMYNDTEHLHSFNKGDKLIQLVVLPIPEVELRGCEKGYFSNIETERGSKGFGSSGR